MADSTDNDLDLIDQFRYLKIQSKTIDLGTRLWGITAEFVGFIPDLQSLVLNFNIVPLKSKLPPSLETRLSSR